MAAVRLDPWHNIVNVHWGGFADYIAFTMRFRINIEVGDQSGTGLPALPADALAYNYGYLTSSEYAHYAPAAPISGLVEFAGAGLWNPLALGAVELAGVPEPSAGSFGYGAFSKVGAAVGRSNEGVIFGSSPPDSRLQAGVGGSDLDVFIPGSATPFKSGSTFTVEHRGDTFSGAAEYSRTIAGGLKAWAPCSGAISPAPLLSNASRYSAHAFDFAGVTASYQGADYAFAGLLARESVDDLDQFNVRININVLLGRVV